MTGPYASVRTAVTNRRPQPAAIAVAVMIAVTGCGTATSAAAARPELAGQCLTGIYDRTAEQFYRLTGTPSHIPPASRVADAYKLVLINTSGTTATVQSETVTFYAATDSPPYYGTDSETFRPAAVISPGHSRTWLFEPWGLVDFFSNGTGRAPSTRR